jgi:hypothetical protein
MSEPTPGEIMRRLDEIANRLDRTASQLQTDRDRADLRYVPRGEWVEGRRADQGLIKDVVKDVEDITGFRRQITVITIGAALSSFGALAVAIIMLILSGGKP